RGFEGMWSYTFSHSIDIASTDAFANYLNTPGAVANPMTDRGNSDFDIRHSFTAGFTYAIPYRGSPGALRTVLGGWSLDGFILARSAPPANLVGSMAIVAGAIFYLRPNQNPGVPVEIEGSGYPGGKTFNKAAFATPAAGQQGGFGRNVLRGFDAVQAD